ncbi:hypothetical protein RZE82_05125 [Mollicutes bacterium LVI A0039]|nr:hypothetical protein RZE82_05125 [Mollicutes bacterium LVI A0039]
MKLYSLKINATDYIEYYVTGRYKGKATYEISENFKLRNKIDELDINIEQ